MNTRAFKRGDKDYLITVGSISQDGSRTVEFKGNKIEIAYGEFSDFLRDTNKYLERAKEYAANDTQREMIECYIKHYESGSIDMHKES